MLRMDFRSSCLAFAAALALSFVALPAQAEVVDWVASLSGSNEVPPVVTAGTGSAKGTIDTTSNIVTWEITFTGLTGPLSASHFHLGSLGVNGPVIITIPPGASPLVGSAPILPANVGPFLNGDVYINLHTAAHPGGEIRGQVLALPPLPVPALSFRSLAIVLAMFVLLALRNLRQRDRAFPKAC